MSGILFVPFLLRDEPTVGLRAASLRYASSGSAPAAAALTSRHAASATAPQPAWCHASSRAVFVTCKVLGTWAAQRVEQYLVSGACRRHEPLAAGQLLSPPQAAAMLFDSLQAAWSFVAVYAYLRFLGGGHFPSPLHRVCGIRLVPESHAAASSVRPPFTDVFMRDFMWRELTVSQLARAKLALPHCALVRRSSLPF